MTLKGEGCRNRHLPFSRYCWRHQDVTWVIGTVVGLLGVVATILVAIYQERSPALQVWCRPPDDGNPCALSCYIKNSGRAEARDVYLSFNNVLLLDTKVAASPELGISLVESENLPDPKRNPEAAKLEKAFAVHVPRISPKDTITFQLITVNPDNQRTGKQTFRMLVAINSLLHAGYERLSKTQSDEAQKWNIEAAISYHVKYENYFSLAQISYEHGRQPIEYFSDEEKLAAAINADILHQHNEEFKDFYEKMPDFIAPVIRYKLEEGESTYARCPPYLGCSVTVSFNLKEKPKKGTVLEIPLTVPESY
jgi:hypothetical protein